MSRGLKTARGGILLTSAFLLAITLSGRLLSMVREMMLAQRIGMNAYTDAFNVSQSAVTFCTGAISATCLALVPILVSAAKNGERRRDETFTSIFIVYMVASVLIAAAVNIFAHPICQLLGPSMSAESKEIAAELLRMGFVKINCVVGGSLLAYYLQSREIFVVSGLASLASSAVVVVMLAANANADIWDYTLYTVYGFVAQLVLPLPFLAKVHYRPRIKHLVERHAFKALLLASLPLLASTMFLQAQTLVGRAIATGLGEGSASSVDYANKLIQLVYASITTSLNSVLFTRLAESAASGDIEKTSRYLIIGGRNQFLLLAPLILLAVFFGRPLVALLFQRGAFTPDDTTAVYLILLGYLPGAWPYVFSDLFSMYCVTLKRYKTINLVNGIGYGISLVLVYPAAAYMGTPGISFSFSLAQIVIFVGFLWFFAQREAKGRLYRYLGDFLTPKEAAPSVILLIVLVVWILFFGEPGPWLALFLMVGFFGFYCLLLLAFRVRIGFKDLN